MLGVLFLVVIAVLVGVVIFVQQSPTAGTEDVNKEQSCTKTGTDYKLSLSRAKEIGTGAECGGDYAENYFCNEMTGTWWIDLNINKPGCSPACVIDVVNEKAEINWRCTGLRQ